MGLYGEDTRRVESTTVEIGSTSPVFVSVVVVKKSWV